MAPKKAAPAAPAEVEPVVQEEAPVVEHLEGSFLLPSGASYVGQYIREETKAKGIAGLALEPLVDGNDKPLVASLTIHGRGNYLFGPERFEGTWLKGAMAKGTYVFASGAVYEGHFLANKFHGPGKYCWPDNREYEGHFADGKMHGVGTFRGFTAGEFTGTALRGHFQSSHAEQVLAKEAFCAEYGAPLLASARRAVHDTEAHHHLLVAAKLEAEWLQGHTLDQVEEKAASGEEGSEALAPLVEEERAAFPEMRALVDGPYCTAADLALVKELADAMAKEAEDPEAPKVSFSLVTERPDKVRHAPLEYVGQCVAVSADPLGSAVLVNVATSRGVAEKRGEGGLSMDDLVPEKAVWRLLSAARPEA